jgi:hypothetical protein
MLAAPRNQRVRFAFAWRIAKKFDRPRLPAAGLVIDPPRLGQDKMRIRGMNILAGNATRRQMLIEKRDKFLVVDGGVNPRLSGDLVI